MLTKSGVSRTREGLSITLDEGLRKRIEVLAKAAHVSRSEAINQLLEEAVVAHEAVPVEDAAAYERWKESNAG